MPKCDVNAIHLSRHGRYIWENYSNWHDYSVRLLQGWWQGRNREDKIGEKRKENRGWGRERFLYLYLPRLFRNTCLRGHIKNLKIENHRAYGPLLFLSEPPETVSQTAVVIGSESFCTSTLNEFLICEANICGAPRGKLIFVWELPSFNLRLCRLRLPLAALLSSKVKRWYISHSAHSTVSQTEGERSLFVGMWCRVFRGSSHTTMGTLKSDTFFCDLWGWARKGMGWVINQAEQWAGD